MGTFTVRSSVKQLLCRSNLNDKVVSQLQLSNSTIYKLSSLFKRPLSQHYLVLTMSESDILSLLDSTYARSLVIGVVANWLKHLFI